MQTKSCLNIVVFVVVVVVAVVVVIVVVIVLCFLGGFGQKLLV